MSLSTSTARCNSSASPSQQPSHAPSPNRQQPAEQELPPEKDRALPAPSDGDGVTTLDVSGDGTTVKLGALGPLVVNRDGTTSRISNWPGMTAIERENTLRVLGKRNKLRLAALRQSQRGGDEPKNDT